jgi:bifunctional DNA-binding transcriptional regulator/antitoxin component of YhaV-PrlF toxin-antitoxin module
MVNALTYDECVPTLKITSSGQVSIPAEVRRRWNVNRVRMVDHGDHITFEPIPDNIWEASIGMFENRTGITVDELRAQERAEDAAREERWLDDVRRFTPRRPPDR